MVKAEGQIDLNSNISRRDFLRLTGVAGAGLVIPRGVYENLLSPENLSQPACLPALNPNNSIDEHNAPLLNQDYVERLKTTGSKVMRIEMNLGSHGSWDAEILNSYKWMFDLSRAAGMEVSVVVDDTTLKCVSDSPYKEWNAQDGNNEFMDKFANTTAMLAQVLGGDRYEVWNEPAAMRATLTPLTMARLISKTYRAVKFVNPNIKIVYGGDLSGAGADYLRHVINSGFRYCGWNQADTTSGPGGFMWDDLGYHLYHPRNGVWTDANLGYNLYDLRATLPREMPIRLTEVGYLSRGTPEGEQVQADNLKTLYQYIDKHPDLNIIEANWFAHHDFINMETGGLLETWGLVDMDGRKKLAYEYYMKYASKLIP